VSEYSDYVQDEAVSCGGASQQQDQHPEDIEESDKHGSALSDPLSLGQATSDINPSGLRGELRS